MTAVAGVAVCTPGEGGIGDRTDGVTITIDDIAEQYAIQNLSAFICSY